MSYTKTSIGMSPQEKTIQRLKDLESQQAQNQRVEVPRKSTIRTGWVSLGKPLSYVSSTTVSYPATQQPDGSGGISYPVDLSSGMKLKFTQSGSVKYFYITYVSVSILTGTVTLEINGGSDYIVVNDDISNVYYSYADNPQNFPHWFDWTPTLTGFSSDPPDGEYRFRIGGGTCFLHVYQPNAGISNANTFTITAPVLSSYVSQNALAYYIDNGTLVVGQCYVEIDGGTKVLNIVCASGISGWTSSGNKKACFHISYEFTEVATELAPAADVVMGAPTVEQATLIVKHALISQDILIGTPIVEDSDIKQDHKLSSQDVSTTPAVDASTISQDHKLTSQDISTTPLVEESSISQEHKLTSQDISSGVPIVEKPTAGHRHDLASQDVSSGTPTVEEPTISQDHELSSQDVSSGAPTVEEPNIEQDHELSSQDVTTGAPTVDNSTLSEN